MKPALTRRDMREALDRKSIVLYLAVAAAHAVSIYLATDVIPAPNGVVPVWAASGVSVAALLVGERRVWPGVLLAIFLANVTSSLGYGTTFGLAALKALANTVEPFVGALVTLRLLGGIPRLGERRGL